MAEQNDGGPAFPAWKDEDRTRMWFVGMSLRDHFAAQCYIVQLFTRDMGDGTREQAEDFDGAARDAYRRADAMLKAREATDHGA